MEHANKYIKKNTELHASLKSLNFKKLLSLKFLKVNRGDVAA